MGMEQLIKAATAAGYAMAPPEDDPAEDLVAAPKPESRALTLAAAPPRRQAREALAGAADWLKGYLPTFGGRAPA